MIDLNNEVENMKNFYDSNNLFPLFKCTLTKTPHVEEGSSWKDSKYHITSSNDLEKSKTWGLICGSSSGIMVLDIDGDNSVVDDLLDEVGLNIEDTNKVKNTLTIKTPSGGQHLYFKYREGLRGIVGIFKSKGGEIDIRTEGNYVIAPFSKAEYTKKGVHISGTYEPINNGKIESMPDSLFNFLKKGKPKVKDDFADMSLDPFNELRQTEEGERNNTFNRVLFEYCKDKGLKEKQIIEAIAKEANTYLPTPMEMKEVLATARSVYTSMLKDEEEKAFPYMNKKTVIKCWQNTKWLMDEMNIKFRYNVISKRVEVNDKRLKSLSYDAIITDIHGMCQQVGYNLTLSLTRAHISMIAEMDSYNPVRDYLMDCYTLWDGESRIEQLFNTFKLNESADRELSLKMFKKWLISCVVMAFNEDAKEAAQGVLTLKGNPGIGKTRWIYSICPNAEWVKEGGKLNPTNTDSVRKHTQYWIVELGEAGATIKKEFVNELKNFITEKKDTYRTPYAIEVREVPRMTVYMATVNDDTFLKDETGDRRFWVIPVDDIVYPHGVDIDLLWGEITSLVLDGKEVHYFKKEEIKQVMRSNEKYQSISDVEQLLIDALIWDAPKDEWVYLTSSEICMALGLPNNKNNNVGRALRKFNREGKEIEIPKNTGNKVYLIPPIKQQFRSMVAIPGIDF